MVSRGPVPRQQFFAQCWPGTALWAALTAVTSRICPGLPGLHAKKGTESLRSLLQRGRPVTTVREPRATKAALDTRP